MNPAPLSDRMKAGTPFRLIGSVRVSVIAVEFSFTPIARHSRLCSSRMKNTPSESAI